LGCLVGHVYRSHGYPVYTGCWFFAVYGVTTRLPLRLLHVRFHFWFYARVYVPLPRSVTVTLTFLYLRSHYTVTVHLTVLTSYAHSVILVLTLCSGYGSLYGSCGWFTRSRLRFTLPRSQFYGWLHTLVTHYVSPDVGSHARWRRWVTVCVALRLRSFWLFPQLQFPFTVCTPFYTTRTRTCTTHAPPTCVTFWFADWFRSTRLFYTRFTVTVTHLRSLYVRWLRTHGYRLVRLRLPHSAVCVAVTHTDTGCYAVRLRRL